MRLDPTPHHSTSSALPSLPPMKPPRRFAFVSLLISIAWTLSSITGYGGIALAQPPVLGEPMGHISQDVVQSADFIGCGGEEAPSSNPDYEVQVVQLINQIRLEHGLLPFKRVATLDNASRFHATDMANDDYFSHNSHDRIGGQLVEVCPWSNRIQNYYSNYGIMAENIAAGYNSPEAVVDAWMKSPGHRSNILNGENWEIGIGYYSGLGSYGHYWVQDLGRNRDVYPLVVNNDASTTSTGELTLHIYGDWQTVRFRNNEGPWSEWQPFHSAMTQRIEGEAGHYTIQAEMRKGNQTVTTSSTIYLTQSNVTARQQIYLPAIQNK